jgi:hypothetical protein
VTGFRRTTRLQILLGALVAIAALSAYGAFVATRSRPLPNLSGARGTQVALGASVSTQPHPAPTAPGRQASDATPSGGAPPPVPSARAQSLPVASPARPQEAVGRPNPFAPLVVPQRSFVGQGVLPPGSRPGFGIGLPLPPGSAAPPPPPGAGMTVGAIIGGSERVAIIQDRGENFTVGVGDHVGDAVVVEIHTDKVVMRKGGVTFELLYGSGGP